MLLYLLFFFFCNCRICSSLCAICICSVTVWSTVCVDGCRQHETDSTGSLSLRNKHADADGTSQWHRSGPLSISLTPVLCVCALSHQIKGWHINFSHQPCTSLPPATVSLSVCVDMCLVVAAATLPNWGCHRLLRPGQRERGMRNGMSLCRLALGCMLQFGRVRGSNRTRNVNKDHDLWVNTLSQAIVKRTGLPVTQRNKQHSITLRINCTRW